MSRAVTTASILYDITLVSPKALSDCTIALTTTLLSYPKLAGLDSTFSAVMNSLSSVISMRSSLSTDLFSNVNEALSSVAMGRQSNMAIGDESVVLSDECRMKVAMTYAGTMNSTILTIPQTDLELFMGRHPNSATVYIFGESSDSVSISVTQYMMNAFPDANLSSSTIKVQTYFYSTPSDNELTVILQNPVPIHYKYIPAEKRNVQCSMATQPYQIRVNCTSGLVAHVPCPGNRTGNFIYTCPEMRGRPQCKMGDGMVLTASSKCRVVAFTSYNTTCKCRGSANVNNTRRLTGSIVNPIVQEIGASLEIVTTEFIRNWESAADLDSSTISKNYIIVSTVASLMFLCVVGFVGIIRNARVENKNNCDSSLEKMPIDHLQRILSRLLPIELSDKPAFIRFWEKSLELHPYLAMLSPENGKGNRRAKQWMLMTCEIVNMIFLNSILYYLVAGGGSVCSSYTTKEKCELPRNLDMTDSLCQWDASQNVCNYNPPTSTFLAVLILTTLVTVFVLPLNKMCGYLINMSALYIENGHEFLNSARNVRVSPSNEDPIADEHNATNNEHVDEDAYKSTNKASDKIQNEFDRSLIGKVQEIRKESTTPSDIMVLLKEKIDDVTAQQEVTDLRDQWRRVSGADITAEHIYHLNPEIQKFLYQLNVRFGITRKMLDTATDTIPASEMMSNLFSNFRVENRATSSELYMKISKVRMRTAKQMDKIMQLDSHDKRQLHIMRAFVSDLQAGQQKKIMLKYMFENNDGDEVIEKRLLKHTICAIFLLMYILGTLFYIFLFGVSIGQHDTIIWLQVLGLSALQSIFIVKPLVIWIQFIAKTSIVKVDIQNILEMLKINADAKAQGLDISYHNMISDTNFVQHLNVGCRLARVYPELPVSRVLASLRDIDLPDPSQQHSKNHPFMKAMGTLFMILALFLIVISQIPEGIQDLVFSLIFTVGTNCVLFSTFFMKEKTTILPIIALLLILGALTIRQYIIMHKSIQSELLKRRRNSLPMGTCLRGAMPRNPLPNSTQRRLNSRKMLKETAADSPSSKHVAREKIRRIIKEKREIQRIPR